jgi:proteasome alpha subunit
MSMPFYVAPEQLMKDRADYARKGIARGRSVIVLHYTEGILFVAENRSQALHKVSEIYDRIGFAAVGRYNEFENLRTAGIRYADLRGYSYDRTDVTGRGLANAYAQLLGTIFSSGGEKPYEVEIVVAELGVEADQDQIYRLTYDGSVNDEEGFAVMGGSAEAITEVVRDAFQPNLGLADAVRLAVRALTSDQGAGAPPRALDVEALEVAVLDRTRTLPRKFRRIRGELLAELLGPASADAEQAIADESDQTEIPPAKPAQGSVRETDLAEAAADQAAEPTDQAPADSTDQADGSTDQADPPEPDRP